MTQKNDEGVSSPLLPLTKGRFDPPSAMAAPEVYPLEALSSTRFELSASREQNVGAMGLGARSIAPLTDDNRGSLYELQFESRPNPPPLDYSVDTEFAFVDGETVELKRPGRSGPLPSLDP